MGIIAYYNDIFLNKILSSVIILLIGLTLANIFGKITKKIITELEINSIFTKIFRLNFEKTMSKLVSYIIYLATIIIILNNLEITDIIWKSILVLIFVIIISDLILHLKDLLPNIYAYTKLRKELFKDDYVITKLVKGKVKNLGLISTKIISNNDEIIYIQNKNIIKDYKFKN